MSSIYPDSEEALLDFLDDLAYTCTLTPLNLKDVLPVLLVQRVGGPDSWEEYVDYPLLLITAFALRSAEQPRAGLDLAEQVRDRLNGLNDAGGLYVASQEALLASSVTVTGPTQIAYLDPEISVYQATYRLAVKGR